MLILFVCRWIKLPLFNALTTLFVEKLDDKLKLNCSCSSISDLFHRCWAMSAFSAEESSAPLSSYCPKHPKKKLEYHCKGKKCNKDICLKCWKSEHTKGKEHQVINLHLLLIPEKQLKKRIDNFATESKKFLGFLQYMNDLKKELDRMESFQKKVIDAETPYQYNKYCRKFDTVLKTQTEQFQIQSNNFLSQLELVKDKLENIFMTKVGENLGEPMRTEAMNTIPNTSSNTPHVSKGK